MYTKLLKLVGVNIIQGIIISGAVMIGKEIYRKIKIDHINKKYKEMSEDYNESKRDQSKIGKENFQT